MHKQAPLHIVDDAILCLITQKWKQSLKIEICKGLHVYGWWSWLWREEVLFCFVWVLNIEFATEDNSDPTQDAFEVSVTASILIQKSHFFSVFIDELTCLKHLLISQNWVCRRIHKWCWHLGVVMQGLVLWQQLVVHAFFSKRLNEGG